MTTSSPDRRFEVTEAPSVPWTEREGTSFPRWISSSKNLREVAPGLYVGNVRSPGASRRWGLVVDLCGGYRRNREKYPGTADVLSLPFEDGKPFPDKVLDQVFAATRVAVCCDEPVLVHCAAGLSRSASAAYALLRTGWGLDHHEALARVQTEEGEGSYPMEVTLRSARRWAEDRLRAEGRG